MQPGQRWRVTSIALAPVHTDHDAGLTSEPCAEGTTTPGSTPAPRWCASAAQRSSSDLTVLGVQVTAISYLVRLALWVGESGCVINWPQCAAMLGVSKQGGQHAGWFRA